jgi:hypothetical protein
LFFPILEMHPIEDHERRRGAISTCQPHPTRIGVVQGWAYFVNQFYQALTQPHTTKATALRQAQRSFLNHPNYRHPIYWSAYVLVGDGL